MGIPQLWINKTFRDLHLATAEPPGPSLENFRSEIERYHLLDAMHTTYALINKHAGRMLLYEDAYLQPQILLRKYTFKNTKVKYQMAFALYETGPRLVFSKHRSDHFFGRGAIEDFYQRYVRPSQETVKYELRVYPSMVNNIDLQEWFTYLLSGLRNSRKPLVKTCFVPRLS